MPERIQFPEWQAENHGNAYPFSVVATLTNGVQTLLAGTFLDAVITAIGAQAPIYLASVTITNSTITITLGDQSSTAIASGVASLPEPGDNVTLLDPDGRPAGLLISTSLNLGVLRVWGLGTFKFTPAQTEFAATVCIPTPEAGLRSLILPDGTQMSGDVWLVGSDGIVLRAGEDDFTNPDGSVSVQNVIRVDVVGDPLYQQKLCTPPSLYQTPRYLKSITFKDGVQRVKCGPNTYGGVKMTVNNALASDTVLRIYPTETGNTIEAVGATTQS